jgi:hypothetical protein
MVSILGAVTSTGLTKFPKLRHKEAQKAQIERFLFAPFVPFVALFAWCLNVDVYLLSSSTSEYPVSKHEQTHEYDKHKNHDYSNDTNTAAATAFFGHNVPPIV